MQGLAPFLLLGLTAAVLLLLVLWALRIKKKPKETLKEKASPFEYSWAQVPLADETKPPLPIHYRLEGDPKKPVVLLIHGLGANLNCWRRLIPLLETDFQVLAFDLPGFGLTPNPESFFGKQATDLTDLVVRLIESLKLKTPVFLIGNSLGGILSLALMEQKDAFFSKALLINPALSRKLVKLKLYQFSRLAVPIARVLNRRALTWLYARTISKPEILEPEVVEHLARNYIRNPAGLKSFAAYLRLIDGQGVPALDYSNCLFIFSEGDRVVTSSHRKRIRKFFPQAKTLFHPSGGHQLQEDEPQWLTEQAKSFFLSS